MKFNKAAKIVIALGSLIVGAALAYIFLYFQPSPPKPQSNQWIFPDTPQVLTKPPLSAPKIKGPTAPPPQ